MNPFYSTSLDDHLAANARLDPAHSALHLFHRAAARVPAYRALLASQRIDPARIHSIDDFRALPLIDKDAYLRAHPLPDLCWDGSLDGAETIAVSSGSTGTPFFFPRGVRNELEVVWRFEQVFRDSFQAHERSTLAVVCFPLGTWVGGMFTAACLRLLAQKGYPLLVVTPGNQPPEIFRAVLDLGPLYEQVVLLGYPPFLKDVIDGGITHGIDWSRYAIKLVMAGEVVTESWRDIVMQRAGGAQGSSPEKGSSTLDRSSAREMLFGSASLYGTADAGVLGNETALSIAIRRFTRDDPQAAEALFGQRRLPTLVQYDPMSRYFETVGERLVFTGDAGTIPLIRYAIGDTGGVIPFREMMDRLQAMGFDAVGAVAASPDAPRSDGGKSSVPPIRELPFVYVFGRAHHAVSLYGANVFVEMVRLGLERAEVREQVSGKFVMEAVEDAKGDRALELDVELARGVSPADADASVIARVVREEVARASGEFASYVPRERQSPIVRVWTHGDPRHFPVGVKHKYVRG
jgi:phenylacetate-CoA ligase